MIENPKRKPLTLATGNLLAPIVYYNMLYNASLDLITNKSTTHPSFKLYCLKCHHQFYVPSSCGKRSCPICRIASFRRTLELYFDFVMKRPHKKLLTLTRSNREILSKEWIKETRKCFTNLLRSKLCKDKIKGGFYAYECVNKGNGWNLHLHSLIESDYIEQSRLSVEWYLRTGDSNIVDIRKVYNSKYALYYLLKDLTKSPELCGKEEEYDEVMRSLRFVSNFGTWYNPPKSKIKSGACPSCGSHDVLSEYAMNVLQKFAYEVDSIPEYEKIKKEPHPKKFFSRS